LKVNHAPARSSFEKILDYFFIKRYHTYIDFLPESNEESNIKLSVLEILTNYLNDLIQHHNFVFICYANFDFSKIRYNFVSELLSQTHKYFNLTDNKFAYLKKLMTIMFHNITNNMLHLINQIKQEESTEVLKANQEYLAKHQEAVEFWESIISTLKLNKPKKLLECSNKLYKYDLEDKEMHKEFLSKIAKSIAIIIKYSFFIDIDLVNEILGGKDEFSKVIKSM